MAQISRSQAVIYIDTAKKFPAEGATWQRIDKSTTFKLEYNADDDTKGYIDSDTDATVLNSYAPSMDQEIILDTSNKMFTFMNGIRKKMPTGADAEYPVLVGQVVPKSDGTAGFELNEGQVFPQTIIELDTWDTADDKVLSFKLGFGGDVVNGTISDAHDGTCTFTPTAATPSNPGSQFIAAGDVE